MNMRKILLTTILIISTLAASAQMGKGNSATAFQLGLETNPGRLMVGADWRYNINHTLRVAVDGKFLFPNDRITGLNVNGNMHYVVNMNNMNLYGLAGWAMLNNRYQGETIFGTKIPSRGWTHWGANLGAGYEYYLTRSMFVLSELKYTFSKHDHFTWGVGIGLTL